MRPDRARVCVIEKRQELRRGLYSNKMIPPRCFGFLPVSSWISVQSCTFYHIFSHVWFTFLHVSHTHTRTDIRNQQQTCTIVVLLIAKSAAGLLSVYDTLGLLNQAFSAGRWLSLLSRDLKLKVSLWKTAHEHLALYFGDKVCLRFILLMQVMLTLLIFLPSSVE